MPGEKVCPFLVGKTKAESIGICSNCPLPQCYRDPCPQCGGRLYYDEGDREFRCLSCARPLLIPKSVGVTAAKTQTNGAKEKKQASMPAPIELKRTVPYRVSSLFETNGAWYPQNQITFRREHMIFLIKSLSILQEGHYPRNPIGTGYTDHRIVIKRGKGGSYFEHPVQLAAEVETRLEACGQDGLLLEALYCWGKRPEYLTRVFHCEEYTLAKRVNSALWYISGWERKEQSYRDFRTRRQPTHREQPEPTKSKSGLVKRLLNSVLAPAPAPQKGGKYD